MKNIEDILFLIQSRTESERVPEKIIRPFAGSSLFEIAVKKICSSKLIPKENFYIFVRDERLIEIGNRYDVNIIERSQNSCKEPITLYNLTHEWVELLKDKYEYFVMLNACNAIVSIETIERFILDFLKSNSNGMFAVVASRNFIFGEDGRLLPKYDAPEEYKTSLESKYLEKFYTSANSLYAGKISDLEKNIYLGTFQKKGEPEFWEFPQEEFYDIDEQYQFELAEQVYKLKYLDK